MVLSVGKILAPVNLTMIYRKWQIDPNAAISYAPALLFAGMTALFFWKRKGMGPAVLVCRRLFCHRADPVLGVFRVAFFANAQVADHFQYFAIPGILALVAAGAVELPRLLARGSPPKAEPANQPPVSTPSSHNHLGGRLCDHPCGVYVAARGAPGTCREAMGGQRGQEPRPPGASISISTWRSWKTARRNEAIQMYNKANALLEGKAGE